MTMDVNQKAGFTKPESAASAMPNVDVDSTAHNEAEVLVATHAQRRKRRIFAAGGTALVGKGMMLLSNAAIVPLTVRYLGAEQFGLWITITSTMTMLVAIVVSTCCWIVKASRDITSGCTGSTARPSWRCAARSESTAYA